MSLYDIVTKLKAVRTKMTASVQNKGVAIPNDSTLYTINKGINMISQGSGETDTSTFEADMTALIGEDANIPPVLVSGMKLYKCVSVDTANKTWTGYELVLNDGKYSVSTVLTDGLQYSSVTPVIGNVYSQDALIVVRYANGLFPEDGLVFHASLNGDAPNVAETGQSLATIGTVTYNTVDGIPCAYFDGNSYIQTSDAGFPEGISDRTLCVWFKPDNFQSGWKHAFGYGGNDFGYKFYSGINNSGYVAVTQYGAELTSVPATLNWQYVTIVYTNNAYHIYVNGVLQNTGSLDTNTVLQDCRVGGSQNAASDEFFTGYVAGCRIYNRALTQDEINTLSNEFTPTA
jgi:hypothetical protein